MGEAGIWGVRAKDETIWVRMHEQNNKPTSKVQQDSGSTGEGWTRVNGGVRQLSVGSNSVWGVKSDGVVSVRMGVAEDTPLGKEWVTVDGEPMRHVSVSNEGHVWACDAKERIWYRKGATNAFALGNTWKMIPGSLRQISIGKCGVWGVSADQQVWFRLNTVGDPDNEGTGWLRVEGRFQQVYSGPTGVFALAGNRDLYQRVNIQLDPNEKPLTPTNEGTHWIRIEQSKESKIIFKSFELSENDIWAIDKDNQVVGKSDIYEDINPVYNVAVYGDEAEFGHRYNFPDKATTSKVSSGAWAIYSEPNFKGKLLYQIGSDCISNDPPNKENAYKSWWALIGSARPVRTANYRTLILKMTLDWDAVEIGSTEKVWFEQEVKNESEDYIESPWIPTFDVETSATHQ